LDQTWDVDNLKLFWNAFGLEPEGWIDASPILHLKDGVTYPDFLVATRGGQGRMGIARHFVDRLTSVGARAQLVDANPYDHGETGRMLGLPGDEIVTPPVRAFLADCVR
jgi:hypothetical protein